MQWLVIIAMLVLTQQPAKTPQGDGTAESNSTQSAAHANNTRSNPTPSAQPAPVPMQTPIAMESQRSGATANNRTGTSSQQTSDGDRATQRKLTWFTGVLAIVGALQLVVMLLTWLVYRRQAREMRRQRHEMRRQRHVMFRQWKAMGEQAKLMKGQVDEMGRQTGVLTTSVEAARDSVTVMKEQSDLMVEKERAKLRIELDEFRPIKDEYELYWVKGYVSIYGSTEAFIERTEIYASIGAAGIFNPLPEWLWGMHLPSVIRSGVPPIPFSVMVMAVNGPATEEDLLPVREAKEFIYCMAKIEFADTYGHKWIFRLRRRFGFMWSQGIGKWEDSGPEPDNGEYCNEAEQRPKPN